MFCPNGALSEGDLAVPSHPRLEFQSPKKLPVAAAKTSFLGAQEGGYTQEPGFGPLPWGDRQLDLGGPGTVGLHPVRVPEVALGLYPSCLFSPTHPVKQTLSEQHPLKKQTLESSRHRSVQLCLLAGLSSDERLDFFEPQLPLLQNGDNNTYLKGLL